MASSLKISVNGLTHSVTASLDTPLLYVLHNELHLHGPRFGCGLAQCGACSVLLNGKEIRSCVTPVAAVGTAVFKINGEISGALVNYDSYDLAGEECQCFLLSIQRGLQTELLFVISVPEINPSIDHNSPWTAYICARSALESE